jgi:hypothetical protein
MATNVTHVRKITVGTPIRKVIGAQAQRIGDLTDVNVTGVQNTDVLLFNSTTNEWESTSEMDGGATLEGGEF